MLSPADADLFAALLTNRTDPLSALLSRFRASLSKRVRTVALTCAAAFIADGLLDDAQQIVGAFLLASEFGDVSPDDHPFLPVLAYALERSSALSAVLSGAGSSVGALSADALLRQRAPPSAAGALGARAAVPRVPRVLVDSGSGGSARAALSALLRGDLLTDYEAPLVRPSPPLLPVAPRELSRSTVFPFDCAFLFDGCGGGESCGFGVLEQLSKAVLSENSERVLERALLSGDVPGAERDKLVSNVIGVSKHIHERHTYLNHVALFCSMMRNVLKRGIRFEKDKIIEIYSFCVEHRNGNIKEAKELAELLSSN